MFVFADPGKQRTHAERRLEVFRVKSYIGFYAHRRPRRTNRNRGSPASSRSGTTERPDKPTNAPHSSERVLTSSDPSRGLQVQSNRHEENSIPPALRLAIVGETFEERRSIQFFLERTAAECSAWYDTDFWQTMVYQASQLHSCIRHGLISLAAAHEATEQGHKYEWALRQGEKALKCLRKEYNELSPALLVTSHILILASSMVLDRSLMFRAMVALFELNEQLELQTIQAPTTISPSDRFLLTHHISPVVDRVKTKLGAMVDILFALQSSPASDFISVEVRVPDTFSSIEHARSILDQLLNGATYQAKTGNKTNTEWRQAQTKFMSALARIKSSNTRESCNIRVLDLSAEVYFMLIELMDNDSEMAFDQYRSTYCKIVAVASDILSQNSFRALSRMESSFLSIVGNAATRWCRCPIIRQDLIHLLQQYGGREGLDCASAWAQCALTMQQIEEGNIKPRDSADIQESSRIRLIGADFYVSPTGGSMVVSSYLKYPYRAEDRRAISYQNNRLVHGDEIPRGARADRPYMALHRGYSSFLKSDPGEYYTAKAPRFYFNISKV